jgi:hypothetical protein
MHYLFAEFKANSNLKISKRFLFAEKRAPAVTPVACLSSATASSTFTKALSKYLFGYHISVARAPLARRETACFSRFILFIYLFINQYMQKMTFNYTEKRNNRACIGGDEGRKTATNTPLHTQNTHKLITQRVNMKRSHRLNQSDIKVCKIQMHTHAYMCTLL